MDERQLLELAAKAAGIEIVVCRDAIQMLNSHTLFMGQTQRKLWNPLTDDGDEARLEAALGLPVVWSVDSVRINGAVEWFSNNNGDKQAARRRAGVRAAAAIGEQA